MPDELLDVINEKDEVIGQQLRSIVHRDGLLHRGVHVFLATPQGQLIVQRRGRYHLPFPGALDCSVSEHVKAGEDFLAAAVRGLEEELGLRSVTIHPLVKFIMNYGPNDQEMCILYEGRASLEAIQSISDEVESLSVYTLTELEAQLSAGGEYFCGWFVELIYWYRGGSSGMQVMSTYSTERLLS